MHTLTMMPNKLQKPRRALRLRSTKHYNTKTTREMPNWQDTKLASTPQERRELKREARALLWKEQEIARKARQAEGAERRDLEEDLQEKKILRQKMEAANREDANFQEVEKEYETDAELVKEEEEELSLLKQSARRKC